MEQKINSDSSFNSAMLASRTFENILHMIKTSNLNYFLQLSPFAAQISLKKSLVKDKSGVPLVQPKLTSFDCTSDDVTDLFIKNRALENKLASLQKDYEAAIKDCAAAQAMIKEYEKIRKPLDDPHAKKCYEAKKEKNTLLKKRNNQSNSIDKKNKMSGKVNNQKQNSQREKCGEFPSPVIPMSDQSSLKSATSPIKLSSLDANYNVKVSNLFTPLSESEESLSLATAKPPSSPSFRDKPPCAPAVTATPASLLPQTPLGTPKPPSSLHFGDKAPLAPCIPSATASPQVLSPRTPSKQEPVNPVMVFEGKPITTEFACQKIKEAFEEINSRFKK